MMKKIKAVLQLFLLIPLTLFSQNEKEVLATIQQNPATYLPDFSYAGYHNGEKKVPEDSGKIIYVKDFGVIANDGLDDSKALISAIKKCSEYNEKVVLQLPKGKIILSSILYLEKSNFVLRGEGSDENGTEIYCPRPMMYLENPESLTELREYLTTFDKRQREKENNIDLPFSQYAWSGGMIWTQVPGERVKSYLGKYDPKEVVLAKVQSGKRGENVLTISENNGLKVGDVVELQLFNKDGKDGEIISAIYNKADLKAGSHHWQFPTLPLVRQQVEITKITGKKVTIKTPLILDIKPSYQAQIVEWKHLSEVGIENLKITFPDSPRVAHHVEQGFNGIFLTRLYDSWVKNVVITNADSGILTEEVANVTIENIETNGNHLAHYTVALGGVHNVLVKNLNVYNDAVHPLSFNTFSTKNVYQNCTVYKNPILDQHSGVNQQNLFDAITVHAIPFSDSSYPLFGGGGADYWKPSHGAFSTFWNIKVEIPNDEDSNRTILLKGVKDGPFANLIGVYGNRNFDISYGPKATIEYLNHFVSAIPSLYDYQLKKRLE